MAPGDMTRVKLRAVILENFRGYKGRCRIDLDDITGLVGRNDAGKSSVLEALEIFFNSEEGVFDPADVCVYAATQTASIGCVFADFPQQVVIDATATTALADEYPLNEDGHLEVHKRFDCAVKKPKESLTAIANHPAGEHVGELLLRNQGELIAIVKQLAIEEGTIDLRSNVSMRRAIRDATAPLTLARAEIPLDKEDAKRIWDLLKLQLPIYAFFRSDRPSQDGDSEVQNPLKIAVAEALKEAQGEFQQVEQSVREKVGDVARRTLDKLREMDADFANELRPDFKAERKWDSLFKFTFDSDDRIPINKRGSGVRRLKLLSFFRAEAERRLREADAPGVIYGIEEPETSQHPTNQKILIEAFTTLVDEGNAQVVLTTHTPALAGLLPPEALRHVQRTPNKTEQLPAGLTTRSSV